MHGRNNGAAAGSRHPPGLAKKLSQVGYMLQYESADHEIEFPIREGKRFVEIKYEKADLRGVRLSASFREHTFRKVDGRYDRAGRGKPHRVPAGATTQVQYGETS